MRSFEVLQSYHKRLHLPLFHNRLSSLFLQGLIVDKEFEGILREIQDSRFLIVRYDHSLPLNKGQVSQIDPKNIFNIDPVRILFYMKEHLRTLDLFLKVDRDGSNSLSRDEMKFAFEVIILLYIDVILLIFFSCSDT